MITLKSWVADYDESIRYEVMVGMIKDLSNDWNVFKEVWNYK